MMSASMKNIKSVAAHNINLFTTAVDRWSPLAYSLADWIQTDVSIHSCHESTFRKSLNFCFILQGLSLFEEIRSSCVFCTKLRAKFIQATMGPKDPSAYALAPPLWVTQAELYGPIVTYVPGRERNTRAHRDLTSKCWAMVFVCNLSKAVNIQVVEGHDAHHLADGLTRLCCEVGAPARLLIDRDSAFMKVLQEGHINILDVENHMRKKTTMAFQLAKNTDLPAYAQPDGSPAPESIHFATPTRSSHCCCTSHHKFCLAGPEPRIHHPDCLSQEVRGHLAHIIWTQEDSGQQHPTDDVFMDNIVALGMSMGIEEIIDEEIE